MNTPGSTSRRSTPVYPTLLAGIVAVVMAGQSTGVERPRLSADRTVRITVTQDARAGIGGESVIITATWCNLPGGGTESSAISVRIDVVGVLARLAAMIPWARPRRLSGRTLARRRRRQRKTDACATE